MPERIQRRRAKGFVLPTTAIYVGRPTVFGNPWRVLRRSGRYEILRGDETVWPWYCDDLYQAQRTIVARYRIWLIHNNSVGLTRPRLDEMADQRNTILAALPGLRGYDLACWCPLSAPCHADVLLEIANQEPTA
ncbi:DUF4326 domain-containing protein [Mycobacterium avium]|uniref:DUF4326 domain-containing protein n=1 Tax=Mycobacterium avium TaxID=1764 RepID=UPI001CC6E456|nr:DUF4326 domain-containing protein [Mycobacterium avium]MBZ4513803.1 DUF4326 domain-containing protein [Mycobacterium avium subsp. hominissuis]MBZ4574678.1 DUF4326 domain-containing protein [Mycobacterium avium subsp. hominissuis]